MPEATACFADVNVSRGIVATYARCGGIFNMHLTANLPRNLPVKKICKSVKIRQNCGHELSWFSVSINIVLITFSPRAVDIVKCP